tara:strand:- start:38 stop:607 length:570 start_codon:yes stop_codon:yes gene_type:complete
VTQITPAKSFQKKSRPGSGLFRRFRRDHSGANAIEFALVAAPFLVMLIGLFEVCMIFIATTTLEHGIAEASRRVRTGELQSTGASAETFKNLICDNTFGMLDCDDKLKVDVRVFDNFGSAQGDDPLKSGKIDDSKLEFDAGEGSDIVLARVFYEWQILTPVIGKPLSNMGDGKRLLMASVAFRNEPFGN